MLVIGLAGGSGSGKGTVSSYFRKYGIPVFNCDASYHSSNSRNGQATRELVQEFGIKILNDKGKIDRRALFSVAFADPKSRERLNEITHRLILERLHRWLLKKERMGVFAVVIDAPLLFEAGLDRECDRTVAVTAPRELRVQRIVRRDGISREEAEERISAQIPDEELRRRADCVLDNDGNLAKLQKQVEAFLNNIK